MTLSNVGGLGLITSSLVPRLSVLTPRTTSTELLSEVRETKLDEEWQNWLEATQINTFFLAYMALMALSGSSFRVR